mgnify:CR=1 FL=1
MAAQVLDHIVIRGTLYAVEGAASITWSGAKWVYNHICPDTEDKNTPIYDDKTVQFKEMQKELSQLKTEIKALKAKIKQD